MPPPWQNYDREFQRERGDNRGIGYGDDDNVDNSYRQPRYQQQNDDRPNYQTFRAQQMQQQRGGGGSMDRGDDGGGYSSARRFGDRGGSNFQSRRPPFNPRGGGGYDNRRRYNDDDAAGGGEFDNRGDRFGDRRDNSPQHHHHLPQHQQHQQQEQRSVIAQAPPPDPQSQLMKQMEILSAQFTNFQQLQNQIWQSLAAVNTRLSKMEAAMHFLTAQRMESVAAEVPMGMEGAIAPQSIKGQWGPSSREAETANYDDYAWRRELQSIVLQKQQPQPHIPVVATPTSAQQQQVQQRVPLVQISAGGGGGGGFSDVPPVQTKVLLRPQPDAGLYIRQSPWQPQQQGMQMDAAAPQMQSPPRIRF